MEAFSEFFPILLLEEAVCEYSAAESVQPVVFFSDADYPGSDDEPADKEEIQGISADNAVRAAFYFHRGIAGMLYLFLSPTNGLINKLLEALGGTPVYFMNEPGWFRTIYIASGIWQGAGWGAILYTAALSGIDTQLYEAATMDGANKWHKIWYIDIPGILPIVVTMLIMNTGSLLSSEFQKTLLLQTPGNISTSDTLGVYVYTAGLEGAQYSYTTAIGLMMNVINFIILVLVNRIAKKVDENGGIW